MTLRSRIRDLESRLAALESDRFNGDMPPRPTIPDTPIDPHGWWRERCNDYSHIVMYDVDDDQATGMYL